MALDFMASESPKNINKDTPLYGLDEVLHEHILFFAQPISSYPMNKRIEDYYSDATILLGEIKNLISELQIICKSNPALSSELNELTCFLEIAGIKGYNIYIFCD